MSFSTTSGLRLITTVEGTLKVAIDTARFANSLAPINVDSIASIALFASQTTTPFKTYSNTLNDEQCKTEILVQGVLTTGLVKEIKLLKLDSPFEYDVNLQLTYLDSADEPVMVEVSQDGVKVLGDIAPPIIDSISQATGTGAGTQLVLNILPCEEVEDVSELLLDEIESISIFVNGVLQPPVDFDAEHRASGNYTIAHTGVIVTPYRAPVEFRAAVAQVDAVEFRAAIPQVDAVAFQAAIPQVDAVAFQAAIPQVDAVAFQAAIPFQAGENGEPDIQEVPQVDAVEFRAAVPQVDAVEFRAAVPQVDAVEFRAAIPERQAVAFQAAIPERQAVTERAATYAPLVAGKEYTFSAFITTKTGTVSEASASVTGIPSLTPNAVDDTDFAIIGESVNGSYVVSYEEIFQATSGSTTAEKKSFANASLQIFAYEHALDEDVDEDKAVPFSKFRKIGQPIKATVNSDYSYKIPAGSAVVPGAHGGKYVRAILVVSNGFGAGARSEQNGARVTLGFAQPSIVAVRGEEVGEWELTITAPTASYQGYMISSYNVEVKASADEWGAASMTEIAGAFEAIDEEEDYLVENITTADDSASAQVMAVESLTPGKTGKLGSAKQFSEVKLRFTAADGLTSAIQFGVRAAYIETRSVVFPDVAVEASDLTLEADGDLKYDTDLVAAGSADAAYSKFAESAVFKMVNVLEWAPSLGATYSADTPDREGYARYELKIAPVLTSDKLDSDNDIKYHVYLSEESSESSAFKLDHIISGTYSTFVNIRTNIDVKRGCNTYVRVMASESDEDSEVVAESGFSSIVSVRPSGVESFGSAIRIHSKQGKIEYKATDYLSLLFNRAGYTTDFDADEDCELRIAIEITADAKEETGLTNIHEDHWERDYKFYEVKRDAYGKVIKNANGDDDKPEITVADPVEIPGTKDTGTLNRKWNLYTISGLKAHELYEFELSADWAYGSDSWSPEKRVELEATPVVPVQISELELEPGNSEIQVTCLAAAATDELNGAYQLKEINKTFKHVAVSTKGTKKTELGSSSSASFSVPVVNGVNHSISVKTRYANPNFGKNGDNEEYIESEESVAQSATAGSRLDKVTNLKVVAGMNANDVCGFTLSWDLAAGREVDVYALFDEEGVEDVRAALDTSSSAKKLFMTTAELLTGLGSSVTAAKLYKHGVTFSVIQRTKSQPATNSAPASVFWEALGQPIVAAGDFKVTSCAESLLIEFSGLDAAIARCAGYAELAAKITYKDLTTMDIKTKDVSDILTANGVLITGLNDSRKYKVECVISDASGNFEDVSLTGANALASSISPAPAPKAVTKLKAESNDDGDELTVSFTPSTGNGAYTLEGYRAYVTTVIGGATKYVTYVAGIGEAAGTLAYSKDETEWTGISTTTSGTTVSFPLANLNLNIDYIITVASEFDGAAEDETAPKVSASTTGRLSKAPEIQHLLLDPKNGIMSALVDCHGSSLISAHIFAGQLIVLNVAPISDADGLVAIKADVPVGTERLVLMVHNARGYDMNAIPDGHIGVDQAANTAEYKEATYGKWKNLSAK